VSHTVDDGVLRLRAFDSAEAECLPPPATPRATDLDGFVSGALRPGRIGLLLARKSAYAVGIADGVELTASKVDSHYVQSRTAAGGWSQQRFARRRANQASAAFGEAADVAVRVLAGARLEALFAGGDRGAVQAVLADRRLAQLADVRAEPWLAVKDPKLRTLEQTPEQFRAVRIRLDP